MKFGLKYMGMDIQFEGLRRAKGKLPREIAEKGILFQSDLTQPLPVRKESVDIVLAHFSMYTLAAPESRKKVLLQLMETIKPRGLMVVVNPSRQYDARRIIRESVDLIKERRGLFSAWAKKWFVYPFTHYLGLKFIERQLKMQHFQAFSLEELCDEMEASGMSVVHSETLYAGGAHLVTARRPSPTS